MEWLPEPLRLLAERQYGLVTVQQAGEWLTPARIRSLRERGVAMGAGTGVLRFAGAPPSWRQRAMAACLAYGPPVAVSHLAAACLWGFEDIGRPPVTVTVPRNRSGRRDGRTRRGTLPAGDVTERHALPVTTPLRTLVDVADSVAGRQLEAMFDHLVRAGAVHPAAVLDRTPARARHADHPLHVLRVAAADRAGERGRSQSAWEDRVRGWLRDAGLPAPVAQHQVLVAGRLHLLDLAWPEVLVAVEVEGWEWHRSRDRFDHDRARTTDLALAGWLVVLVTAAHGEAATVERVRRALAVRGWPHGHPPPAMLGA